jgi:hypothetical protein
MGDHLFVVFGNEPIYAGLDSCASFLLVLLFSLTVSELIKK